MSSTTPPNVNPLNLIPATMELDDVLDLIKKEVMLDLNCHHIATIQEFNSSDQTIRATINYTQTYYKQAQDGTYVPFQVPYPILVDVPVIILGGGPAALTFPIASGDECLILFNDRDLDNWYGGASSGAVNSNRLHSFSDGLALVGFRNISGYDAIRALISNGTVMVGINPQNNKVTITNGTSLNSILQTLVTHLQSLASACAALTVTGVSGGMGTSGPPVNASDFSTLASDLASDATAISELLE